MNEAYGGLVDAFGGGGGGGDPEEFLSVFPAEAVFLETPFSDKETGHAAIRRYWTDLPANQAEVTFRSGEIYVAGPWFATEFRCTYRRRRSGEWVDAPGARFCERQDGKFSAIRMYWHGNP